jgi:hypothetical protein
MNYHDAGVKKGLRASAMLGPRWALPLWTLLLPSSSADEKCADWAAMGECATNERFMGEECAETCRAHECAHLAEHHCQASPNTMAVSCPGVCKAMGWLPPAPRCPAGYECNATAVDLEVAGMLEQCVRWAALGECSRNEAYMVGACPLSCAEQAAWQCVQWAAQGECDANSVWMGEACGAACEAFRQREECSAAVCSGNADDSESSGAGERWRPTRRPAPYVSRRPESLVLLTVRNDMSVPFQLWFAPFAHATETGYGVLAPGARVSQDGRIGDRWRFRALPARGAAPSSGALLRQATAGVITARPCHCAPHVRDASEYTPALGGPNASSVMVVQSGLAVELVVLRWDGTAHVPVGTLWPPGSRAVKETNASTQLQIDHVYPGDLIAVAEAHAVRQLQGTPEGASMAPVAESAALRRLLLMQHLHTDLVIAPCSTDSPARVGRKADGRAAAERDLERERRKLQADNTALRAELERLQKLGSLGDLSPGVLQRALASANATLTAIDTTGARGAPAKAARARPKRNTPRRQPEGSAFEHDELR